MLLTVFGVTIGFLIGVVVGLVLDFLGWHKNPAWRCLRLWYRACLDLRLEPEEIEKTVGKGMAELLAEAKRADRL